MKKIHYNVANLSKYEIEELQSKLLSTLKKDLNNKYGNLIRQKEFNLKSYEKELMKEIKYFSFHNYPFYNQLFRIVEKKFLKEISNYSERDKNGLLTIENIDDMVKNYKTYDFNICTSYNVGKISLRKIINEEDIMKPVDKYPQRQKTPKKITKNDIMKAYNKTISSKNALTHTK